jgi:hypothetical protein
MRALALALLLANLLAAAWLLEVFGPRPRAGVEPQRLAAQVAPERLRLLSAADLQAARTQAQQVAAAPGGLDFSGGPRCVELGDFAAPTATQVQARLAPLDLGERLTARQVQSEGWLRVYLPPARSRAEAERQLAAARQRGLRDAWLLEDGGPLGNAVIVAAFREAEAARQHAATLEKSGFKGARVAAAATAVPALRLRIDAVDATLAAQLAAVAGDYPGSRLAACGE